MMTKAEILTKLEQMSDAEIYKVWNEYCKEDDTRNPVYKNTEENVLREFNKTPAELEAEMLKTNNGTSESWYWSLNNYFISNEFYTRSFDDFNDSEVFLDVLADWLSAKTPEELQEIGFM